MRLGQFCFQFACRWGFVVYCYFGIYFIFVFAFQVWSGVPSCAGWDLCCFCCAFLDFWCVFNMSSIGLVVFYFFMDSLLYSMFLYVYGVYCGCEILSFWCMYILCIGVCKGFFDICWILQHFVVMVCLCGSKEVLNMLVCVILELHFETETCVRKVFVELHLMCFLPMWDVIRIVFWICVLHLYMICWCVMNYWMFCL